MNSNPHMPEELAMNSRSNPMLPPELPPVSELPTRDLSPEQIDEMMRTQHFAQNGVNFGLLQALHNPQRQA